MDRFLTYFGGTADNTCGWLRVGECEKRRPRYSIHVLKLKLTAIKELSSKAAEPHVAKLGPQSAL